MPKGTSRATKMIWIALLLLSLLKILPGDHTFFEETFGYAFNEPKWLEWWKWLWHFGTTFLLFAILPMLIWRFAIKDSLKHIGFQLGDWKFGLTATILAMIILPLPVYFSAQQPEHLAMYPRSSLAVENTRYFLIYGMIYLLHYIGWEVFYRGFIGLGMRSSLGTFGAIMLQTLLTTLMHIGKPFGETIGTVFGGIYLGLLTYRTGSIFWAILFHWYLGLINTYFCGIYQG